MTAAFVIRHTRIAALGLALVLFTRLAGAAVAASLAPQSVAQRVSPSGESAHVSFERTLPPMRGDRLHVALVQVTYAPGASSLPHVHRCPVSGYVVSGALRTRSENGAEEVHREGESFQEGAGQAHLVSANASATAPVTFLAYFVCDGDGPRSVALTREIAR